MTVAEDLLRRHIEMLVADDASWQMLLAEDVVWELPFAPALGHPARCQDGQKSCSSPPVVRGSRRELPLLRREGQAAADPEAAVAEVKGAGRIKATGRVYRQEYVVFLRASAGKIAFLREYFDPTRAAKAMNTPILDLDS